MEFLMAWKVPIAAVTNSKSINLYDYAEIDTETV